MDEETKAKYRAKADGVAKAHRVGVDDMADAALKGLEYIEGFMEDAGEPQYRALALEQVGRYLGAADTLVAVVQARNDLEKVLTKGILKKGLTQEQAKVTADIYLAKILKLWVEKDKAHDTE